MNIGVFTRPAAAHNWGSYHWNKGGSAIYIYHGWQGGCCRTQANAAMSNAWNTVGILYNYWAADYTHTNVSVWSENNADTWGGLASLENMDWDWGSGWYNHIAHAHARYNSRYGTSDTGWIQGVYCQELFHTYGFDHDNQGNCMGLSYYSGSTNFLNSHNNTDFYNRYRNH